MSSWGNVTIHKKNVKPGERVVLNIDIAKLHTRTPLDVPIIIERAKRKGPTVLITGGIHGDEVNGVEIVRQILADKYNKPQCGMVICIPVINIFGFINHERYFPDGRDLNRSFPGSAKGSLAARYANFLIKEICPHVDYIIDLHTGGAQRFNYSQIRYNPEDKKAKELAEVFGAKFLVSSVVRDKSFRQVATDLGKTVIMFEGGQSMFLDKAVTRVAKAGILRVLNHLGIRDFSKELAKSTIESPIVITDSTWVRARYSGLYRSYARIGSYVHKGDKIGTITDPFGDFEFVIKAKWDGYIICGNHYPIVNQGDALMHISKKCFEKTSVTNLS